MSVAESAAKPLEEPQYVLVYGSGELIKLPTLDDKTLGIATLTHAFPGASGLKYEDAGASGLKYEDDSSVPIALLVDPGHAEQAVFRPPTSGWSGKTFHVIYNKTEKKETKVSPVSKRPRHESLSRDEEKSFWDHYKHFLFYMQLSDKERAAASLLDQHHLVLCLHEIPQLQFVRQEIMDLFDKRALFLSEYDPPEDEKKTFLDDLSKQLEAKEVEMKKITGSLFLEFFDYNEKKFVTTIAYYNWRQDVCIVESVLPLSHRQLHTEFCDRGTEYIILGFKPPDDSSCVGDADTSSHGSDSKAVDTHYTYCVVDGMIAGSAQGKYLYGVPGAFPGLSGGPVIQKFGNGTGRLIGICSGSDAFNFGLKSSIGELLNGLETAKTNVSRVLILPTFLIPLSMPPLSKRNKLMKELEDLHLSRPPSRT